MTREQAKAVLLLYRPWMSASEEPEMLEALSLAREDRELHEWFAPHCESQQLLREKLRSAVAPESLRARIVREHKAVAFPVWWRRPKIWAAAAVLIAFAGVAALLLSPRVPDGFADYRDRVVRSAIREYRMDLETGDEAELRSYMAMRGAPADYVVPPGLSSLKLTGGGLLHWRNHPVTMVCFDRGDSEMLFLFVMERQAVADPPAPTPEALRVSRLQTVSWSAANRTYVLAGAPEEDFVQKYGLVERPGSLRP